MLVGCWVGLRELIGGLESEFEFEMAWMRLGRIEW